MVQRHRSGQKPPLSIGIVISTLGLLRGGLETIATRAAAELAERGHRVTLVSGYWPGRHLPTELRRLPVTWTRVPCVPLNLSIWERLFSSRSSFRLLKIQSLSFYYASRFHPRVNQIMRNLDVTMTFLEVETVLFSRWRQSFARPNASYFPGMIDWNWLKKDRSVVRVAISDMITRRHARLADFQIDAVVPPGLDEVWYDMPYEVRPRARRLLYVGRLEANKGLPDLVKIFHSLAQEHPDIELILIGDGPLRDWLLQLRTRLGLDERLVFAGSLPPEDVRQSLMHADGFLFPSKYESFGIAVLEAMAVGVPVLCSDLPALREVAGQAACFLPVDEVSAWTAAAQRLLADRGWRVELSQAGRLQARRFNWSNIAMELEKYLYQAVEQYR